jgi:hypothetical protein
MCERWKNGQLYTLKIIHKNNPVLYKTIKEKMRIELENLFIFSAVKHVEKDKGMIMDWLGLVIAKHGAWLTFENWMIFINNLKLGMVAGESVEFYEKLNLPKIASWLNEHRLWVSGEIVKELQKLQDETEAEYNKNFDERRKKLNYFIKLFKEDPTNKMLTQELISEIKKELEFRDEMARFFEANKYYLTEVKTVRDLIDFRHEKQNEIKEFMQKISIEADENIKQKLTKELNQILGIKQ